MKRFVMVALIAVIAAGSGFARGSKEPAKPAPPPPPPVAVTAVNVAIGTGVGAVVPVPIVGGLAYGVANVVVQAATGQTIGYWAIVGGTAALAPAASAQASSQEKMNGALGPILGALAMPPNPLVPH